LLAELVHESLERSKDSESEIQLVGVDLVEVSPIFDHNNQTATVAADWVASLLGKTILGELR
jgi:arginase family enzyme